MPRDSLMPKPKYPGLIVEKTPKGQVRWRVRVKGRRTERIALPLGPDHPGFDDLYQKARQGIAVREAPLTMEMTGDVRSTAKEMLKGMRVRSARAGRDCDMTLGDIISLIESQGGKCALTGRPFDLRKSKVRRRPWAPSVDRISNQLGYVKGNVRAVAAIVNTARADWPDDDFRAMCESIANALRSVPRPKNVGHPDQITQDFLDT